jgi:hypothetical protein
MAENLRTMSHTQFLYFIRQDMFICKLYKLAVQTQCLINAVSVYDVLP